MRFVDEVRIRVTSGDGGKGCSSFRREKYIPRGGPDGGDGGKGGDVVLVATRRRTSLLELRGKAWWRSRGGQPGRSRNQTGAHSEDVEILVPVGTMVLDDETGDVLADLDSDEERWVAAKGGDGGRGNARFKTSTNRAPRKSTPGFPGLDRWIRLELRLLADVGLVGLPNAGKSTLISRISAARPKVADYPFTTLVPNLGVVGMGVEGSFVVADVPGLVQGASDGAGLGHRFLKHVQRTRILLHLVSLSETDGEDPTERYRIIRKELEAFDPHLAQRSHAIVLTKADSVSKDRIEQTLRTFLPEHGESIHVISAVTGQGIDALLREVWLHVQTTRVPEQPEEENAP